MLNTHPKHHCIQTMNCVPLETNIRSNLSNLKLSCFTQKIVFNNHKVIKQRVSVCFSGQLGGHRVRFYCLVERRMTLLPPRRCEPFLTQVQIPETDFFLFKYTYIKRHETCTSVLFSWSFSHLLDSETATASDKEQLGVLGLSQGSAI